MRPKLVAVFGALMLAAGLLLVTDSSASAEEELPWIYDGTVEWVSENMFICRPKTCIGGFPGESGCCYL